MTVPRELDPPYHFARCHVIVVVACCRRPCCVPYGRVEKQAVGPTAALAGRAASFDNPPPRRRRLAFIPATIQEISQAVERATAWVEPLEREISRIIVGQKYLIDRLLVALSSALIDMMFPHDKCLAWTPAP